MPSGYANGFSVGSLEDDCDTSFSKARTESLSVETDLWMVVSSLVRSLGATCAAVVEDDAMLAALGPSGETKDERVERYGGRMAVARAGKCNSLSLHFSKTSVCQVTLGRWALSPEIRGLSSFKFVKPSSV